MTIYPPKLEIDPKEPFKHALFGRQEFGKSLVSLLRNVSDNLVVFVNAPWGTGKTTFAQMWLVELREVQKLDVVYYDAYAVDYFDDPFVSFSGEILELADRLNGGTSLAERDEFKKSAVQVGKRLAGLVAKIGLRAATLGALESSSIDELKEIASDVATGVSEIGEELIEKRIENYTSEKDALAGFKKRLATLAARIREQQGFPLTFIVDELDRCRPDFALKLLERIKHLFDVEGVAFILLVNREQIENYIRAVYGDKVDARSYLLKFGNLFVDLPDKRSSFASHYVPGTKDYCVNLAKHYGLSKRMIDSTSFATWTAIFADHFELSFREIEKVFAVVTLYYSSTPAGIKTDPLLISVLSVLKIKLPTIFEALAKGMILATPFFEATGIKRLELRTNERPTFDWLIDTLEYFLMSDEELTAKANPQAIEPASENIRLNEMRRIWGSQRKQILPALCWGLDRFSLQPA